MILPGLLQLEMQQRLMPRPELHLSYLTSESGLLPQGLVPGVIAAIIMLDAFLVSLTLFPLSLNICILL